MTGTKNLRITLLGVMVSLTAGVCAQNIDGKASYYANSLHGRKMSNGQPYDRNRMTCAHRTLPFGTKLRVTNSVNGKQVIVEVTDRGPFVRGRVIDLSYAAARELGTIQAGVGYVQIEILPEGVTVPYQSESSPFEIPEVEYGMAGVCYEFIPEWKEEKEEPKEKAEKAASAPVEKETAAKPQAKAGTPAATTAKPQATAQRQQPATQKQQSGTATRLPQKKEDASQKSSQKNASKTWSEFFEKMKSLF